MRLPGASSRNFGARRRRLPGRRKSASTVACLKSASNMSPWTKVARSATPAAAAFFRASSTISGPRAALRGRDHYPPVARAEVDDEVARRDGSEIEHLLDQRARRRHPHDILAGLAFVRLERLRLRRRSDG